MTSYERHGTWNIKAPHYWPLGGGGGGGGGSSSLCWISINEGQNCEKRFHLMASYDQEPNRNPQHPPKTCIWWTPSYLKKQQQKNATCIICREYKSKFRYFSKLFINILLFQDTKRIWSTARIFLLNTNFVYIYIYGHIQFWQKQRLRKYQISRTEIANKI